MKQVIKVELEDKHLNFKDMYYLFNSYLTWEENIFYVRIFLM